jgi:hypothetical protein
MDLISLGLVVLAGESGGISPSEPEMAAVGFAPAMIGVCGESEVVLFSIYRSILLASAP